MLLHYWRATPFAKGVAHQTSRSPVPETDSGSGSHGVKSTQTHVEWECNISLHEGGMTGIGGKYKTLIELAAQRTGLSTEHIKVMLNVKNLT